jgi:hypothetical protein
MRRKLSLEKRQNKWDEGLQLSRIPVQEEDFASFLPLSFETFNMRDIWARYGVPVFKPFHLQPADVTALFPIIEDITKDYLISTGRFDKGNEERRKEYIRSFLVKLVVAVKGVRIEDERPLGIGQELKQRGRVELVVSHNSVCLVVIECQEAGLADSFRAQCLAELIYLHQSTINMKKHVYAILTNAEEYEFYSVDYTVTDIMERKLVILCSANLSFGHINFGADVNKEGEEKDEECEKWSFTVAADCATILGLFHTVLSSIK